MKTSEFKAKIIISFYARMKLWFGNSNILVCSRRIIFVYNLGCSRITHWNFFIVLIKIRQRNKDPATVECSICLGEYDCTETYKPISITICGHNFCERCKMLDNRDYLRQSDRLSPQNRRTIVVKLIRLSQMFQVPEIASSSRKSRFKEIIEHSEKLGWAPKKLRWDFLPRKLWP